MTLLPTLAPYPLDSAPDTQQRRKQQHTPTTTMSNDLQWLLVRKWNSFQHPGVKAGPTLSKEKVSLSTHFPL